MSTGIVFFFLLLLTGLLLPFTLKERAWWGSLIFCLVPPYCRTPSFAACRVSCMLLRRAAEEHLCDCGLLDPHIVPFHVP